MDFRNLSITRLYALFTAYKRNDLAEHLVKRSALKYTDNRSNGFTYRQRFNHYRNMRCPRYSGAWQNKGEKR